MLLMINIYISSLRISTFLAIVLICICLGGVICQLTPEKMGYLALLFDFDRQTNISTWYQSSLLLFSSVLLAMIAKIKHGTSSKYYIHWTILSVIPLFFSLDKMVGLHKIFQEISRNIAESRGVVHYIWIASILALIYSILTIYLALHDDIPKSSQILIIVTFIIYLEGVIGMDLIKNRFADIPNYSKIAYLCILSLREFLETISVIVLIYALISYVSNHIKDIQFLIEDKF